MRKSVLILCCVALVVSVWAVQASAARPTGPRVLLEKYLEVTPSQWKAMSLAEKQAATRALDEDQRAQFRRDLAAVRAAKAEPMVRPERPKASGARALGTIQYDTGPALGAYMTGNYKGNRFDVAPSTMGAVGPIKAPGTITQVSAYVLPAPPPGSPGGTWASTNARFRILGAATGGVAGGPAPLLTSTNAPGGTLSGTQVQPLASPVTFPGPSFHVGVRDDPGWSSFWTSTWTYTFTNTYTNTYTYTFPTSPYTTTMYTTMSYYTYTTMYTSPVSLAYSYAVPGYVNVSTLGQGFHAVAFGGATTPNVVPISGVNMMVRATGNVIVPVELMRFVVE